MTQPAPTYFVPRPSAPPIYIAGASGEAMNLARAVAHLAVACGYRNGDELAHVAEYWRQLAIQCGARDMEEDDGQ